MVYKLIIKQYKFFYHGIGMGVVKRIQTRDGAVYFFEPGSRRRIYHSGPLTTSLSSTLSPAELEAEIDHRSPGTVIEDARVTPADS